jgi:hypothetical protein
MNRNVIKIQATDIKPLRNMNLANIIQKIGFEVLTPVVMKILRTPSSGI